MMDYDFRDLGVGFITLFDFITLLNCRRVFPKFMSNPISIIAFSFYPSSSEYISLIIVQDFFLVDMGNCGTHIV